ncbi:phage baseplate assembly protein V [Frankia sp. CiP1_Cm_nod2]|uniref:phage baseplate assembly protein V n=1 Tax=Frankia sp. CiP1_Cm_nod2 TaxID=2897161 RepID=UPI002024AB2C
MTMSAVEHGGVTAGGGGRYYGKYRGFVTRNTDPDNLGRIRAVVPELLGSVETGWALPALPYAGPEVGLFVMPPEKAGVWIEFEAGDVCRPVWTGCWWSDGGLPKDGEGSPAEAPMVLLRTRNGLLLTIDDEHKKITVGDADGKNTVTVDISGGTVTVKAAKSVVVDAGKIELTKDAAHPLAFGDALEKYLKDFAKEFSKHMHPGQSSPVGPVTPAPPAAPMTPPSGLTSSAVKTG